jgi:hypothetical protein
MSWNRTIYLPGIPMAFHISISYCTGCICKPRLISKNPYAPKRQNEGKYKHRYDLFLNLYIECISSYSKWPRNAYPISELLYSFVV